MVLPITFSLSDASKEAPYTRVEEMPRFAGCEQIQDREERSVCANGKMYQFMDENVRYPEVDREKGVEGMGVLKFIVQANGQLRDIQVVRSPSASIHRRTYAPDGGDDITARHLDSRTASGTYSTG